MEDERHVLTSAILTQALNCTLSLSAVSAYSKAGQSGLANECATLSMMLSVTCLPSFEV
jgi:hypothetical protein